MKRHNLGTVISFEFLRTVTKARFWVMALAIPVFIAIVVALTSMGTQATQNSIDGAKDSKITFAYTDPGHWIVPAVAEAMGGTLVTDGAAAQSAVQQGTSEAYFAFPADPSTAPISVYGKDVGLIESGKYGPVAQAVFASSVAAKIGDPSLAKWAATSPNTDVKTYANGAEAPGFMGVIAPGLFLVIFYLAIIMLGNQMLNVTLEEKENRVTEMILTTMNPSTLIVGKVIALVAVGILQALVMAVPTFLGAQLFGKTFNLGALDLSKIPIPPLATTLAFLLFVGSFLLFAGLLVAIGSIMPNAREAGSAFGMVMLLMFIPLYAVNLIVSDPHNPIVGVFTFFPLTAPVTSLLRNAMGSLSLPEALIVLVILFATAAFFLAVGVRLFRTGSISYEGRLNVRKALGLK